MIMMSAENRTNVLYIRTNRRVRWDYAEYKGRWESVEKAVEVANEEMGEQPYEYLVVEMGTGETLATGLVNWKKKKA